MSRWRVAVVAALLAGPFVVLAGVGTYYLWERRWWFYAWWPMAACMGLGYLLAWYWQRRRVLLGPIDFTPPFHWTDRDRQAWELVKARAEAAVQLDADRLSDPRHYLAVGQEMGLQLAAFYHPGAADPVANLTLPELLAVVELASHDLAEMVDRYLPGGHLLTVRDWRLAKQATEWYQSASNAYWLIAALFSPVNTGLRYVASRFGIARPMEMLQKNLLLWFYTAYLNRLGNYLIDLNSGRLRVGATRYRALVDRAAAAREGTLPQAEGPAPDAAEAVPQVVVTLLGQVKAGKSSLVNALLGEQRARTDVLPATAGVERYELRQPGILTQLVLLDTVGYGHAGPKADQVAATCEAARQSDLLLLVLHARNPARQADLDMLRPLREWFAARPDLKMPPILGVLTHIDLLSPALEWAPPYHWQMPISPKEHSIKDAAEAVREQLGELVGPILPVCVAPGKVYGIEDGLLPVVADCLDEAHAVALLRCLKAEVDTGKVRKVFHQLAAAGREMAKIVWQSLRQ
jgi:predicted GTPase